MINVSITKQYRQFFLLLHSQASEVKLISFCLVFPQLLLEMAAGFLANEIFERVNKRKSVALRIIRRLCLYSLYNLMVFDCLFPEIINPSPETSSIYSLCCPRYIKCMLCVCLFHFEVYVCLSVCIVTCSRAREKN